MVEALELITAVLAVLVYGTDNRPRPWGIAAVDRLIAFTGAAVAALTMFHVIAPDPPGIAIAAWALCGFVVLTGEYQLGRPAYAIAAWQSGLGLFVLGLAVGW